MALSTETTFLYGYTVFIFFIIFMIGLGAPTFVDASAQSKLLSIQSRHLTPAVQDNPILSVTLGFFLGVYNTLDTFYTLLAFSSSIRWITLIIVFPYTVAITYIIAKLLRGGG
jgi:hypothetical protein